MKLCYDKRLKDPTYFIQASIRRGAKVTSKNVVRIGKHSQLLEQGIKDPLAYAKEEVRKFNEDLESDKIECTLTIDFNEKLPSANDIYSKPLYKNIGYFFLNKIYNDLQIPDFITKICGSRKSRYDANTINRILTFARILDPRSKLGTFDRKDIYFEDPEFSYQHIVRFMDVLVMHYDEYIEHLFKGSGNIVKRDTSLCYFDCTNFYFEKEGSGEDEFDEVTGELISSLIRYGVSKEHRPNPIVQMGLFMDGKGIPISMVISPGNQAETDCAIPAEEKMLRMFENKSIVYCSDAGLGYTDIRAFNSMGGRKFIVTQSVKKLAEVLKEAVFNDFDYKLLEKEKETDISIETLKSFDKYDEDNRALYNAVAYKTIDTDLELDTGLYETRYYKNGNHRDVKVKGKMKQRIIITFSRKMMEYQRKVRNRQVERAEKLLESMDPDSFRKGPNDVTRYIKRKEKENAEYIIDSDRIAEEEKYDGYYALATNMFDESVRDILEVNSRRYQIEDCFRILKSYMDARPVNHYKNRRITAHFLICYTALLIYRLLEVQLKEKGYSFSVGSIIETLKNMNVSNYKDLYYQSLYTDSQVCRALNELYDLKLDRKNYRPQRLKKLLKS